MNLSNATVARTSMCQWGVGPRARTRGLPPSFAISVEDCQSGMMGGGVVLQSRPVRGRRRWREESGRTGLGTEMRRLGRAGGDDGLQAGEDGAGERGGGRKGGI